ncbi:MAG: DUF5103 domain-containing protein [Cytophagales bacterium]|nr:MAG: DUF5103 domain-containing protein [Cytophagales bacterium]
MKYLIILVVTTLFLVSCLPIPHSTPEGANTTKKNEKIFTTQDFIYEPTIKTVQLFPEPAVDDPSLRYRSGIISLMQNPGLVLEFDELTQNPKIHHAKIVHCNYDWTPSNLNEIEYLNDVNDFLLRNFELSFNTKVNYSHYSFKVPKVKIAGNYLICVYREGDEKDYLFTKRFIIYEPKVRIEPKLKASNVPSQQDKYQQIDFKINYNGIQNVINPKDEFNVIIRQNYRNDNAVISLKPLMVRDFDKILEYNYFTGENTIGGGNEFRRFDVKSTRFLGFNVAHIDIGDTLSTAILPVESSRGLESYFRNPDLNGGFVIFHFETNRGKVESDYIKVKFTLKAPQKLDKEVYVIGGFNGFACNQENKMIYDEEKRQYLANILLKQGEYNYMYGVLDTNTKKIDLSEFEGNHQDTENNYEILVYHKPFGARTESLVGYYLFNSNQMR